MSDLRPSRRDLLAGTIAGVAVGALASRSFSALAADPAPPPKGPLTLAPLPYADTALAPAISQNTLSFHYGKHHKAYVDNGNKAIAGSPLASRPIPEILAATFGKADQAAIYNNVGQAWNHDFYWKSMRPGGGGAPSGRLADKLKSDLGGYDAFKGAFSKVATGRFGSGWAWLVSDAKGKLQVIDTPNADSPLTLGLKPLVVLDVWEHAYYLDYQNRRADYVTAWLDKLVNWEFAEKNLG